MKEILVYSDGSSIKKNNVRYGGIGVFFNDNTYNDDYSVSVGLKDESMTNQRAELLACAVAMEQCVEIIKKHNIKSYHIHLYTDSKYTINSATVWVDNWIANKWKRKVGTKMCDIKHIDIIKKIYNLTQKLNITFHHINSHMKEPPKTNPDWVHWNGNDKSDKLAYRATKLIEKTL